MGPSPRRPGDPIDRDFLRDRKSSGLPFPWRKAIMLAGLVATFVGTLLLQLIDAQPFSRKPDSSTAGAAQILTRLSAIEAKIDELSLIMTTLSLGVQASNDGAQAIQKRLAAMVSDRRAQDERNSSRSAEILSILAEFRERGVKRK